LINNPFSDNNNEIKMKKSENTSLSFRDLSSEEITVAFGGSSFAYDAGRVLRFLGIAAGGMHGPAFAVADWVCTSFLEE
jgi:hypothetical protein